MSLLDPEIVVVVAKYFEMRFTGFVVSRAMGSGSKEVAQ